MGVPAHAQSAPETLTQFDSRATGLTAAEARQRLASAGANELPAQPAVSAVRILTGQLNGVIAYLLMAAVGISFVLGDRLEALAIAGALVINTAIGFATEYRARRAMEALIKLDVPTAAVIRDGSLQRLDARDLVTGDVIEVEAGGRVPADARLLQANELAADEAPLTGESMPVEKSADAVLDADTALADRTNMIHTATTIVTGHGRALVTATGRSSEMGRIGQLVAGIKLEPTPLERRLDALGRRLVWLTLGVAALVAVIELTNGVPLADVVKTAVALAIAAVPEALPAVATIALAVGMHRMAKRRALVRRLPAVESLGSTTVICTDKTRTLTSGDMTVVRLVAGGRERTLMDTPEQAGDISPEERRLLESAALASKPQADATDGKAQVHADPVDRAILAAAERAGIEPGSLNRRWRHAGLVPFSSARKLMAAFYEIDGRIVAFVKGAAEQVLALCREPVDARDANDRLAGEGLRILAVASGEVAGATAEALKALEFRGLIGLADPPARGVKETIAALRGANLRTIILTGDQRLTAESVGRELGVIDRGDTAIDGPALDRLDPAQLGEAVARHAVFSRITPEHKLRIVQALQNGGEIVAMLGDGVNDAAALKQADIGVAMGTRGTDAAKQAAAIVLQDDRFGTIAAAVEEGRVIFDNIRKFVFYLFSCNLAEILLLLITGVAGWPLPLMPLQLLWLNLVTDTFPALSLALEPAEPDVMRRPPRRPDDVILSRAFIQSVFGHSAFITGSALAAYLWGMSESARQASTLAFMTLAFAQISHLGNARQLDSALTVRQWLTNRHALGAVAVAVGLQVLAVLFSPLRDLLRLSRLDGTDWLIVILLGAAPGLIGQLIRWRRPRR